MIVVLTCGMDVWHGDSTAELVVGAVEYGLLAV